MTNYDSAIHILKYLQIRWPNYFSSFIYLRLLNINIIYKFYDCHCIQLHTSHTLFRAKFCFCFHFVRRPPFLPGQKQCCFSRISPTYGHKCNFKTLDLRNSLHIYLVSTLAHKLHTYKRCIFYICVCLYSSLVSTMKM